MTEAEKKILEELERIRKLLESQQPKPLYEVKEDKPIETKK
jgi:hypothetical protein